MESATAALGQRRGRKPQGRASANPARQRFALAGFALAIGAGIGAPTLARITGLPFEGVLVAILALGFVVIGWLIGNQVDALTEKSLEDPITRVGNRRHWEECLGDELDRAVRSRMPLSVLMLDVDNLKKLNDAHGHACGDRALSIVGEVLLETCRSRDVPARFGGDEFAILLPRTRASEAKVVAERIRAELARKRVTAGAPLDTLLTVSIGIADLEGANEPQTSALFEAADQALYAAKQKGRDRIEVTVKRPSFSGVIILEERRRARAQKAQ
jgi:diguanylate cyclase (GGDEF)-like protein